MFTGSKTQEQLCQYNCQYNRSYGVHHGQLRGISFAGEVYFHPSYGVLHWSRSHSVSNGGCHCLRIQSVELHKTGKLASSDSSAPPK